LVKFRGSTPNLPKKLTDLRVEEANGTASVAVKCVNIGRNTNGESSLLEHP